MAAPTNWIEELQKGGISYPLASSYILDTTQTGDARFKTWQDILDTLSGSYTHTQTAANTLWTIAHNLDKLYPRVLVLNGSGDTCVGNIDYVDANNLTITFSEPLTGIAFIE